MTSEKQQDRVTHIWVIVPATLFLVAIVAGIQGNDGAFAVLFVFACGVALGSIPIPR